MSRIPAMPNKALKSLISFAGTARRPPLAYSLVSVRYGSIAAFDDQYMEFQPMFNRPPHLAPVWGPFFVATKTRPPWTGIPT